MFQDIRFFKKSNFIFNDFSVELTKYGKLSNINNADN